MLVDIVHEIVSYQLQNQFPIFEATVFFLFSSFNQLVGIYNVALGERKVGQERSIYEEHYERGELKVRTACLQMIRMPHHITIYPFLVRYTPKFTGGNLHPALVC